MTNQTRRTNTPAQPPDTTDARPATPTGSALIDSVTLPVVRLPDRRRRLYGSAWARPFPPAAAAMPIKRWRLTTLIGWTITSCGGVVLVLSAAGAIPAHLSGVSLAVRIAGAATTVGTLAVIVLARDEIDRWWLGVRSARAARRWPPVTVFGVLADPRPEHDGCAVVALHPHEHGSRRYTRRGEVLCALGLVPESAARRWQAQLADINRQAATGRRDSYEVVLEGAARIDR